MKIPAGDIIFYASFLIFFTCYFFFSQKIYTHNRFILTLIVFILISIVLFYFNTGENYRKALFFAVVFGAYLGLLFGIKKFYRSLNHSLIKRKLINKKYSDKDFTMVYTTDWGDDVWDKKASSAPSWLDQLLSIALLLTPLLVAVLIV